MSQRRHVAGATKQRSAITPRAPWSGMLSLSQLQRDVAKLVKASPRDYQNVEADTDVAVAVVNVLVEQGEMAVCGDQLLWTMRGTALKNSLESVHQDMVHGEDVNSMTLFSVSSALRGRGIEAAECASAAFCEAVDLQVGYDTAVCDEVIGLRWDDFKRAYEASRSLEHNKPFDDVVKSLMGPKWWPKLLKAVGGGADPVQPITSTSTSASASASAAAATFTWMSVDPQLSPIRTAQASSSSSSFSPDSEVRRLNGILAMSRSIGDVLAAAAVEEVHQDNQEEEVQKGRRSSKTVVKQMKRPAARLSHDLHSPELDEVNGRLAELLQEQTELKAHKIVLEGAAWLRDVWKTSKHVAGCDVYDQGWLHYVRLPRSHPWIAMFSKQKEEEEKEKFVSLEKFLLSPTLNDVSLRKGIPHRAASVPVAMDVAWFVVVSGAEDAWSCWTDQQFEAANRFIISCLQRSLPKDARSK